MLCKFRAATSHIFFSTCNENFDGIGDSMARSCCRPKQHPSLRSIFLSLIGLGVKIWHRNKTACFQSNPVQRSWSKSTTRPRKGRVPRFEGAQKLGNDVRRDSESIATKVCSQIGRKWNAMFESHVETYIDRTSFNFRFEDFFNSLPL